MAAQSRADQHVRRAYGELTIGVRRERDAAAGARRELAVDVGQRAGRHVERAAGGEQEVAAAVELDAAAVDPARVALDRRRARTHVAHPAAADVYARARGELQYAAAVVEADTGAQRHAAGLRPQRAADRHGAGGLDAQRAAGAEIEYGAGRELEGRQLEGIRLEATRCERQTVATEHERIAERRQPQAAAARQLLPGARVTAVRAGHEMLMEAGRRVGEEPAGDARVQRLDVDSAGILAFDVAGLEGPQAAAHGGAEGVEVLRRLRAPLPVRVGEDVEHAVVTQQRIGVRDVDEPPLVDEPRRVEEARRVLDAAAADVQRRAGLDGDGIESSEHDAAAGRRALGAAALEIVDAGLQVGDFRQRLAHVEADLLPEQHAVALRRRGGELVAAHFDRRDVARHRDLHSVDAARVQDRAAADVEPARARGAQCRRRVVGVDADAAARRTDRRAGGDRHVAAVDRDQRGARLLIVDRRAGVAGIRDDFGRAAACERHRAGARGLRDLPAVGRQHLRHAIARLQTDRAVDVDGRRRAQHAALIHREAGERDRALAREDIAEILDRAAFAELDAEAA